MPCHVPVEPEPHGWTTGTFVLLQVAMQAEPPVILLALTKPEHWQLVQQHLSPRFHTLALEGDDSFPADEIDLVVTDRQGLATWDSALAARRERDQPLHLPVLLLSSKKGVPASDDVLWDTIDDVAWLPIGRDNLLSRVHSLLRGRRYSKALDTQRRLAEELSREKDEILRIAAHDLKAPAATAQMAAKLLLNEELSAEEQRDIARSVLESADRLVHLLDRILDVERIEQRRMSLDIQETDVVAILQRSVESAALPAQLKEVTIQALDADSPLTAAVDPVRMEEVFDNLLSNAIKYSHRNTAVALRIEAAENEIAISFSDQGIGIHPDQMHQLFHKFGRIEKPTAGETSTGLGLAIAKKLVELHEGRIEVESSPGEGSTFVVKIPRKLE